MKLEILTSGIWQTNSTILENEGVCLVVDPAYFPRELEAIAARTRAGRRVEATVFTHGHWDHVMGHVAIGAPVWLSSTLDKSITDNDPRAAKYLEDAREFDSRWYVPRAGYAWPQLRRGLGDKEVVELGGEEICVLHLPGHSPDGLGLVLDGALLVGDYLSPCEIPFVDDPIAYLATLARLTELIAEGREVIPGHGRRLTAPEALQIAREDIAYLEGLVAAGAARLLDLAHALQLPRAADVVGMRDHHLENCAKVGL